MSKMNIAPSREEEKMRKEFFGNVLNNKINTSYPLNPNDWSAYKIEETLKFKEENLSFYIHIPFCQTLCKYCEYIKYLKQDDAVEGRYIDILEKDILKFTENHSELDIEGFDIGGGTPTVLSLASFDRLLGMFRLLYSKYNISDDFTASIEATFNTIDNEQIKLIAENNIKRISFGLQNVSKKFLMENNRAQTNLKKMESVVESCRLHGIQKVNFDIMYGFINQREEDLYSTVDVARALGADHITLYELRVNMIDSYGVKTYLERYKQYDLLYKYITSFGYKADYGQNTFSLYDDEGVSSYLRKRMLPNGSYKGFGISAQSKSREGISYNVGKNHESLADCLKQNSFEDNGDTYILPPYINSKYLQISSFFVVFHNLKRDPCGFTLHFLPRSTTFQCFARIANKTSSFSF